MTYEQVLQLIDQVAGEGREWENGRLMELRRRVEDLQKKSDTRTEMRKSVYVRNQPDRLP